MKERYQELEEKTASLRDLMKRVPAPLAEDFMQKFEMSWIYHDAALEGVVYTPQELAAALSPTGSRAEASMMPVVLEIRNHKAVCDFLRQEAEESRRSPQVTMAVIKRIHDLFLGNTPEAQAARAAIERREKSEKELAKERERAGFRKDMPLHRTYFHEIAQPAKIQPQLEKLVEFTTSAEFRESHAIKQAATFQHMFLQIFPFTEHSGKVGRMCSNLLLLRNGFQPAIIHSIDRQRYYEAFRGTAGNFRNLLMDAMENSLDNGLKYFRDLARRYRAVN